MESIMCLVKFNDVSACLRLRNSMNIHDVTSFVIKRWPEVKNRMYLGYNIPNITSFCELNNQEDYTNMLEMAYIHSLKQIDITVYRNIGESSRSKDYFVGDNSNSVSRSASIVSTEVSSTLVPEYDMIKDTTPVLMTFKWHNCITGVNQIFRGGPDEFRMALNKYSLYKRFTYDLVKNNTKKIVALCTYRDTLNCTWRIQGCGDGPNALFYIKKYSPVHTCGSEAITRTISRAHSSIVAEIVEEKMRTNPFYRPVDCQSDLDREYGLDISYSNAWLGIEKARSSLFGEFKYSFDQLRLYCDAAKESNPGSHIVFESDAFCRFKRLFLSFKACSEGFNFCRPILFVDSTFLTGRYRGQMLAATAKDGNNHLFPVAYAMVDSESKDNWEWFMRQLSCILNPDRLIVFVSDRNEDLLNSVMTVFPNSPHSYCTTHLKTNIRDCMGKAPVEIKEVVIKMFNKVIDAKTVEHYNRKMKKLKDVCGKRVIQMLDEIEPVHYVDCFFPGKRYGESTSNEAESLNKKFKEECQLPLYGIIDGIRVRLMNDITSRRDASAKLKLPICPVFYKLITTGLNVGSTWDAVKVSDMVYEVKAKRSVLVDLNARTCTCCSWQVSSFPCAHALAAILKSKIHLTDFIDHYYLTPTYQKTYELNIFPIPTLELARSNRLICQVWPPKAKAQPARCKNTRVRSSEEFNQPNRKMKCSVCNQLGHNRKGCRQFGET